MSYLDVDFFIMLYKLKNLNQDIKNCNGSSSSDEYESEEEDKVKQHGTIWIEKMLEASYIANL